MVFYCKMQGDPSSTPLSNSNEDNIWEVTLTLLENTVTNINSIHGKTMRVFWF